MSITYDGVIQQIIDTLGNLLGVNPAQADSNFTAAPSTSTVSGPDFVPSEVQPRLASAISEIVEAIASTPKHPERQRFADVTASLANLAAIPQTGSGGSRIIGVPGFVRDASDSRALDPAPLDAVRNFNRFSSTVYSGFSAYLYCLNGGRIEHTRTNVVLEVCVYTRPVTFTGAIPLEEWHESGLVQGTIAKMALKESMFADLQRTAQQFWNDHVAQIRNYGQPELYTTAQAAPSTT